MKLVRVVLDTNVVVSAHLNADSFERHVLDLVLARKLQLAVSSPILAEYEGVLFRPKFALPPKLVTASLRNIRMASKLVHPRSKLTIAHDPADNRFLECAETARSDYLVTGNKRHYPQRWRQTLVVNAHELIEWVASDLRR